MMINSTIELIRQQLEQAQHVRLSIDAAIATAQNDLVAELRKLSPQEAMQHFPEISQLLAGNYKAVPQSDQAGQ